MKKLLVGALVGGLLLSQITASNAIQFAGWTQQGSSNTFTWTMNPAPTPFAAGGTLSASAPFLFTIQGPPTHFGSVLAAGTYMTNLTFTGTSTLPAQDLIAVKEQDLTNITWKFTLNDPSAGIYNGMNILSSSTVGTPAGFLLGASPTQGPNLTQDQTIGDAVDFQSDIFLSLPGATEQVATFSYSNGKPGPGASASYEYVAFGSPFNFEGYIKNFTVSASGTASANENAVPEPGTVAMLTGLAISGSVFGLRRRRK